MDYIEKLLVSRRKKKRIVALSKNLKPAQIAERIGCTRQYVEQVIKKYETGKANAIDRSPSQRG